MNFYVFASIIIFCLVISHNVRRSKGLSRQSKLSFWERERLANQTRRQSLDGLDYVKIPLDTLPMHLLEDQEEVSGCLQLIDHLSTQPIVNLTGVSNTDLKLEYGAANITALAEYDQNYTLLANTLQRWAELLYRAGYVEETAAVLEFAVSTRTDVSHAYTLLADIYISQGRPEKIAELSKTAQDLHSLNRDVILRKLSEKC